MLAASGIIHPMAVHARVAAHPSSQGQPLGALDGLTVPKVGLGALITLALSSKQLTRSNKSAGRVETTKGRPTEVSPVMSDILKTIDLADHAIRRAVFAVRSVRVCSICGQTDDPRQNRPARWLRTRIWVGAGPGRHFDRGEQMFGAE